MKKIALIGGRGYTGSALLTLIARHPKLSLALVSSSSQAGTAIQTECPDWPGDAVFIALTPEAVGQYQADVWVLAVPNGKTDSWCRAIAAAHSEAVIIDLSADHRFDSSWVYGLPEHHRQQLIAAKRIANPGCYATAAQLAIRPVRSGLTAPPAIFAVSGYSGAGKTPSSKNSPKRLKDNLIPYQLSGHIHEKEISRQLQTRVRFMPHVAGFFRGISLTISLTLDQPVTTEELLHHFKAFYQNEPFVQVMAEIPEVQTIQQTPLAQIGGFTISPEHANEVVIVATLDNLLKGAASQAMQNINLSLGFAENLGISG